MLKKLAPLFLSLAAVSAPVGSILFDNNTDISLEAYIAGHRGRDIAANAKDFPVPFFYLNNSCAMAGTVSNCPVEFYQQGTGTLVARVMMDSETGGVVGMPELQGEFATDYHVSGWQEVPVSHIYINKN